MVKANKNGRGMDMMYRGPIAHTGPTESDARRVVVTNTQTVSSDASGNASFMFDSSSVVGYSDWANLSGAWKEVRVLGLKAEYEPFYTPSSTTLLGGAGAVAVTHEVGASAVTNAITLYGQYGSKAWNIARPVRIEWRASDTGEMNFTNSASPTSGGGIQFAISGLTPSTTYGRIFLTAIVEFRYRN